MSHYDRYTNNEKKEIINREISGLRKTINKNTKQIVELIKENKQFENELVRHQKTGEGLWDIRN